MSALGKVGGGASARRTSGPLTRRELVILQRLRAEVTFDEIGASLHISRNTVKSHVRTIYRKLGVTTRARAVAVAESSGLLSDAQRF